MFFSAMAETFIGINDQSKHLSQYKTQQDWIEICPFFWSSSSFFTSISYFSLTLISFKGKNLLYDIV